MERWAHAQRAVQARRLAGPQHRVPALPDAGRRLAASTPSGSPPSWPRRPGRPRCTPPGSTPSPTTTTPLAAFVADVLADAGFVADLEAFLAEHRLVERGGSTRWRRPAAADLPRRTRPLPGHRALGSHPGRPDNRRPVDYDAAPAAARRLADAGPEAALARAGEGGPKLWLIHRLLGHRRRHPGAYRPGSGYEPLPVSGREAAHVVAFTRPAGWPWSCRGCSPASRDDWADTTVALPGGGWVDVLTGDERRRRRRQRWPRCCGGSRSPSWAGRTDARVPGLGAAARRRRGRPRRAAPADGPRVESGVAGAGTAGGWWTRAAAGPGHRLRVQLDGGPPRPDPRSAFQPEGIDGPSGVVDHAALRLDRQRLAGGAAARGGPLRVPRRHVLSPRAPSTARSSTWTTWSTWASTPSSCCPSPSSPASGAGATTASTCSPRTTPTAARTA